MNTKMQTVALCLALALLLAASACQGQSTPAAVVSVPTFAPPAATATEVFQGAIPVALPAERLDQAGDVDSSRNANKKVVSGGDVFVHGLYERPFNADTMDKYFPYVDIVDTQGYKDDTWGYSSITLAGNDPDGNLPAMYAAELDTDRDGRGDWLILASNPASTEWTRQGVQAWQEPNDDIGGNIAMTADNKPLGGAGYETLVFDAGQGDVIDGAWVRISPDDPKTVELSFKLSMIGDPASYAMGAWAGTKIDPALFDHNDAMTHIQAGSPLAGYQVYPLKALAEIDNTCRLAIGFAPSGKEPGLCTTVERQAKESGGTCIPRGCSQMSTLFCVPVVCP